MCKSCSCKSFVLGRFVTSTRRHFSALDTKTSLELWNGVFCSDLLQNRTVILITQHAWIAQEANVTIVMDNGRVQSLKEQEGHVRRKRAVSSNANATEKQSIQSRTSSSAEKGTRAAEIVESVIDQERPVAGAVGPLSGKTCFAQESDFLLTRKNSVDVFNILWRTINCNYDCVNLLPSHRRRHLHRLLDVALG